LLNEVFRFIKASFNKRLGLYFGVVVCFTMFGSMPIQTLKLPFFFAFIPFAAIFLYIFSKNFIYPNFKFIFLYKNATVIPAPKEFQDLAKRMGTSITDIKIIQSDKKNAFATKDGIAFTKKLLDELSTGEILGVTAHEIAHKKNHHVFYRALILAPIMISIVLLWSQFTPLVLFNEAITQPLFQIMMETALFAFLMVAMIPASWCIELKADAVAARFVGKQYIQSALLKLTTKEEINQNSETHPSTSERIKYIENLKL
jgi:Zn-dependent protease with chaperone function